MLYHQANYIPLISVLKIPIPVYYGILILSQVDDIIPCIYVLNILLIKIIIMLKLIKVEEGKMF